MTKQATCLDVARACGVSTATVSMALRGMARVAPRTRKLVEAQAARLGYSPDNAASLLGRRRAKGRVKRERMVVAVLDAAPRPREPQAPEIAGFDCRFFRLTETAPVQKLLDQLWHQGVAGIVLRAFHGKLWPVAEMAAADWSRFCVVKLSRALPELPFHLVRHSAADYMRLTLEKTVAAGYRRIAVIQHTSASEIDDDARYGVVKAYQERRCPPGVRIDMREVPEEEMRKVSRGTASWLRSQRPDAVIVPVASMFFALRDMVPRLPARVGVAALFTNGRPVGDGPTVSGCDTAYGELHARALELLRDLILRGERGFVARVSEHVVEPQWIEGETLPPVPHPRRRGPRT